MLDVKELATILEKVGVRPDAYAIDGSLGDERLVLLRDGHWVTFCSERDLRTDLRSFANEREACEYLARALLADRSTRASSHGTEPCSLCGSPKRELWAIKKPQFLDLAKMGNWCKLERCCGCEALWCEVPYEPYGAFPYLARWHFSEADWAALHGRDDGKTVCEWNAAMVRTYCFTLPADELSEVESHRKRSYGRTPIDELSAFDLGELEELLGKEG